MRSYPRTKLKLSLKSHQMFVTVHINWIHQVSARNHTTTPANRRPEMSDKFTICSLCAPYGVNEVQVCVNLTKTLQALISYRLTYYKKQVHSFLFLFSYYLYHLLIKKMFISFWVEKSRIGHYSIFHLFTLHGFNSVTTGL